MSICITGGSSGVGRAVAERFAAPGVDVFVNYHSDDEAAAEAGAAIEAAGGTAHLVKADIGSLEGVQQLVAAVSAEVDRLDQLVHAAAMAVPGELIEIDGDALDAAVRTLLADPARRRSLGRAGRARAMSWSTPEEALDEVRAVYTELAQAASDDRDAPRDLR